MATKKQIAEQALRKLSGGHLKPDRTLDIRELMLNLDQLRDELVRENTKANIKSGAVDVDPDYLSFFESILVSTDAVKNLSYIELPVGVISLPLELGLFQIGPIDDMEDRYIITRAAAVGSLTGSQALINTGNTYCWPIGDRVYFKNLPLGVTSVTVILVASSKDIGDNDDYPVAPDDERILLDNLVAAFGLPQQTPHDEAEDGIK